MRAPMRIPGTMAVRRGVWFVVDGYGVHYRLKLKPGRLVDGELTDLRPGAAVRFEPARGLEAIVKRLWLRMGEGR